MIKILNKILYSSIIFISLFAYGESVDDLNWITENYPPYNFADKNGIADGLAVKSIEKILINSNSTKTVKDIEVLSWTRGYQTALTAKNTALFSTARTSERENLFKWVGPITSSRVIILSKTNSNIELNTLADLSKYSVGAIKDDVGEQLVLKEHNGLKIDHAKTLEQGLLMLNAKNIDLLVGDEESLKFLITKNNLQEKDFKSIHNLQDVKYWIAINKETDDTLVKTLQEAFDKAQ